jgi:asparaginyl-tRNA synthetase
MATVYIDELSGTDTAGLGTLESPYQSLGHAIFASPDDAKYLVRKDAGGEYAEPTQSSLKKAKKTADGLEKKKKKAEELKERELAKDTEEKEKREKLLEESKRIVLVEDDTLPQAKRVCSSYSLVLTVTDCRLGQDFSASRVQISARQGVRLGPSSA